MNCPGLLLVEGAIDAWRLGDFNCEEELATALTLLGGATFQQPGPTRRFPPGRDAGLGLGRLRRVLGQLWN